MYSESVLSRRIIDTITIIALLSYIVSGNTLRERFWSEPNQGSDGCVVFVNFTESSSPPVHQGQNPQREFLFSSLGNGTEEDEMYEIQTGENPSAWLKRFNPNGTLRVLCHGHKSASSKPLAGDTKTGLLGNSVNVNIVMVGWEALANHDFFQQAIKNMKFVGKKTVEMINYVYRDAKIDRKDIRFIEHDLGAHVDGIAGERLQRRGIGQIGRPTALDPSKIKGCHDAQNIIDGSEVEFMEAIHTPAPGNENKLKMSFTFCY